MGDINKNESVFSLKVFINSFEQIYQISSSFLGGDF